MRKLGKSLAAFLSIVLALSFLPAAVGSAAAADPEELTFAVIQDERMAVLSKRWQSALEYLSKKLGKKINFYSTTSYASVVEAMLGGFVDFAKLGPKIYLVAAEKSQKTIVPIVGFAKPADYFIGPCACYHTLLITKKGGPYTTIESLKGKVLALVDPGSTSGNAVPRTLFLEKIGGKGLEEYFGKVFYSGTHDASVVAVAQGRADAAFTASETLSNAINTGLVKGKEDFNYLWQSPQIPLDNISVNTRKLSPEMAKRIQDVLLHMHEDPEGKTALKELFVDRFVVATDETYDPVRKMLAAGKK